MTGWQRSRCPGMPSSSALAAFCSSVAGAVVAWVYLQPKGLDRVGILDARYPESAAGRKHGKVYKRTKG